MCLREAKIKTRAGFVSNLNQLNKQINFKIIWVPLCHLSSHLFRPYRYFYSEDRSDQCVLFRVCSQVSGAGTELTGSRDRPHRRQGQNSQAAGTELTGGPGRGRTVWTASQRYVRLQHRLGRDTRPERGDNVIDERPALLAVHPETVPGRVIQIYLMQRA